MIRLQPFGAFIALWCLVVVLVGCRLLQTEYTHITNRIILIAAFFFSLSSCFVLRRIQAMPPVRGAKAETIRKDALALLKSGKPLETAAQRQEDMRAKSSALSLLRKKNQYAKELAEKSSKLSSHQVKNRKGFIARGKIEFFLYTMQSLISVSRFDSYPCA